MKLEQLLYRNKNEGNTSERQTDRQIDRQTDSQAQTERQTDRQIKMGKIQNLIQTY